MCVCVGLSPMMWNESLSSGNWEASSCRLVGLFAIITRQKEKAFHLRYQLQHVFSYRSNVLAFSCLTRL